MCFITLTEMPHQNKILVNASFIIYIENGNKDDTYVRLNSTKNMKQEPTFFFVKEKPDEIGHMIALASQ